MHETTSRLHASFFLLLISLFVTGIFILKAEEPTRTAIRRFSPLSYKSPSGGPVVTMLGASRARYFRYCCLNRTLCSKTVYTRKGYILHLRVQFKVNSDTLVDREDTIIKLRSLSRYLKAHPGAHIILSGNTGLDRGDTRAPVGGDDNVLNSMTHLNGHSTTTGELMIARANTIRTLLITIFHIQAGRITTRAGMQTVGPAGRNVGVEIRN